MRQGQLYELPSKPDDYRKLASDGQLQLLGGRGVAAKRLASGRKRKPSGASAREHQPQANGRKRAGSRPLRGFILIGIWGASPRLYCDLFRRRITQGAPKRERYSGDLMNALTISAFTQSPKEFNFPSQNA